MSPEKFIFTGCFEYENTTEFIKSLSTKFVGNFLCTKFIDAKHENPIFKFKLIPKVDNKCGDCFQLNSLRTSPEFT